jgi:PST family polysaccharide transporter
MLTKIKNIANTEDKKRLLSNFFSLSILQAFTYILPLLTLPYLVRVLGVDKFGLVMFAQAFIMFFALIVEYGFILSAPKDISVNRNNKEKITEIFSSVITIQIILLSITFLCLNLIIYNIDRFSVDIDIYNLTFLIVIGQVLFPIWYFQGMERMKYITIVNIISKVIFTVLIFIFIQNPNDYIYVPLINGFGSITGATISLFIIHKHFNQSFKFYSIKILFKYLKDSTQYFISRITNAGNHYYLIFIM